jgi:hypothetical protein
MVFAGLAFQAARRMAGQYVNGFNQLFWRHRASVASPARCRNNSLSQRPILNLCTLNRD